MQNGKLIGAVTHVLIDDPTKGFGIFAENMLKTAQSVGNGLRAVPQENNELKEVKNGNYSRFLEKIKELRKEKNI